MIHDIFLLFQAQEAVPFIILAFFAVGLVIIFEKFIMLQFVYRINFSKYNKEIKKMLLANDTDRARSFARSVSLTGAPMIASRAIEAFEYDPFRVRSAVTEEVLDFFPNIRRRLTQLPNLAATCLILGSLAAVNGIWNNFRMTQGVELGIKSFIFSAGLIKSLLPLALSLAAAVVLMLFFGILEAVAWRLEAQIEHSVAVVVNVLAPDKEVMFVPPPEEDTASPGSDRRRNDDDEPDDSNLSSESQNDSSNQGGEGKKNGAPLQAVPDEEEII